MGQINVTITVRTKELKELMPNGGEIKEPEKFIIMQDDEVFDAEDATTAEITTFVSPGAIIMWTIKGFGKTSDVQFTNIQFQPGILIEPPVLFYNQRKCLGVINKNIEKQPHGYYVEFYMDGDPRTTWYWDPFIQATGGDDPKL
jgi:hypothetical protein